MPIVLPTEASAPSKRWIDQKHLMIGQGKIGKSAFWACGSKTLFFEFEPGLNHLTCMRVPIRSWGEFRDGMGQLIQLAQGDTFPYDTLIIDTIDMFVIRSGEEIVERARAFFSQKVAERINTIGDIPEGKGWFQQKQLIQIALDKLTQLPAAIVLIGHVQNKEITEPTRRYHKDTINIGGQVGVGFLHWADHTLHVRASYSGQEIRRVIRTMPSESLEAGSRGQLVPDHFVLNGNLTESYQTFRQLFD